MKATKAVLLKEIDHNKTIKAYEAAAEVCRYKARQMRHEKSMKDALKEGDMIRYWKERQAAAAYGRAIKEASQETRGAKPALNKAGTPSMKTKTGGQVVSVK